MKLVKLLKGTMTRATALALLPAAWFMLTSCASTSQPPPPVGSANIAYTKGVPGGVLVQTVKVTATVTGIDPAERKATLLGDDAKPFTLKVGPKAVHFDQIRVGDRVTATVTQKVAVSLDPTEAPSAEGSQITAKIIAIDSERRMATLRFENGTAETFQVRDDLDLSRHKIGEQLVFRVTDMIATWVEKTQ
jgi:Cu/Ag efflux protein CusF